MPDRTHLYRVIIEWNGDRGIGTSGYRAYSRDHIIAAAGKPDIPGSSDPAFLGDTSRWNPEELLVASLSACHQLWYLHLASEAGLIVTAYRDEPIGRMVEGTGGAGQFEIVTLRPRVILRGPVDAVAISSANALHEKAHAHCFIARSMAFPVECEPVTTVAD